MGEGRAKKVTSPRTMWTRSFKASKGRSSRKKIKKGRATYSKKTRTYSSRQERREGGEIQTQEGRHFDGIPKCSIRSMETNQSGGAERTTTPVVYKKEKKFAFWVK